MALCCRLKKGIIAGTGDGVYVFNQDSYDFLTTVSKSGSDYRFLRGVLILPDEYTTTNAPPYAVSTTGFVSPDPSKPVLVKLDTQVRQYSCQLWLWQLGHSEGMFTAWTAMVNVECMTLISRPCLWQPSLAIRMHQ